MKISVDVECTPEEARAFLGLPDVGSLHEEVVAEVRKRLKEGLAGVEAEAILKNWLSGSARAFELWEKVVWSGKGEKGGS